MSVWLQKFQCMNLGGKFLQSLYTLLPFFALALVLYFSLYFIAKKMPNHQRFFFNSLAKGLGLGCAALGVIRSLVNWGVSASSVSHLEMSFFIFILFFLVSSAVKYIMTKVGLTLTPNKQTLINLLARLASLLILGLGLISALNEMGYDLTVVLGSLGISALALSLAIKDSVSNMVSGFLIILYEPFVVGSHVSISGKSGVVEKIELKYVTIREDPKKIHILPNTKVLTEVISLVED